MMEITQKNNHFDFFDGKKIISNCNTKTLYYFGSDLATDFINSYIIFKNGQNKINIGVFGEYKTCWKYLSNFQPPARGFELNDLITLCKILDIDLIKQFDNNFSTGFEVLFKNSYPHDVVVITEVYGGRQPEGVYIHSILFVNHESTFKQKYFNCS
ncbi:hypothetical protein [Flavobacterium sp. I3-2]|uniref:hypothetical protein n=1 Tax=Flavobacterium sp. I3-2 TaxID=2748319 RepID=UPI0015AD5B33|nr:hypothetical protein [Flavobacterium sp. I3-2]